MYDTPVGEVGSNQNRAFEINNRFFMKLEFNELIKSEAEQLAEWISSDRWPTFSGDGTSKEDILKRIGEGKYFNDDRKNFWVINKDGSRVGLVELYDLSDLTPMFSIRMRTKYRNQGYGSVALEWLCDYVFETYPDKLRLEAQTREDNKAMQKLFDKCFFVKEAYYREAWPVEGGKHLASVAFGLLRNDWLNKSKTEIDWKT